MIVGDTSELPSVKKERENAHVHELGGIGNARFAILV